MKKIYVVMGSTGEYSDRREWAVGYFENEAMAKLYISRATAFERSIEAHFESSNNDWVGDARIVSPFDPLLTDRWDSIHYYYRIVNRLDTIPDEQVYTYGG